jgi:crotonobetainyl-CoA:carnitine CoA-transferase CaiB-like acyl-CoA transferase
MAIQPPGPLTGIRVLDLSSYIAGPYGASLLADLGAEVIKVEPPEGDNLRQYPSTLEGESRAFLGVNRSKLGIVLDLKTPGGVSSLLRLAARCDVFLHSFRPAVPRRLGIGYETLRQINSRLIYCALSGYGETGPMRDKPGYDQVLQTMTGICKSQGTPGGPPAIVYGSVVDYHAGSLVAFGISSGLYCRERTGKGQKVEVSLLASALAMQSARFIRTPDEPRDVDRDMRSGGVTGLHPTAEGYLYISANTPQFWNALCELAGLQELASDERYSTVRKRSKRAAELIPLLREKLRVRSAIEWESVFGERVPCAAVRPLEDMFDHPQVLANGLATAFEHAKVGRYTGLRKPLKFSETPGPEPFAAPALGQHTDSVIGEETE